MIRLRISVPEGVMKLHLSICSNRKATKHSNIRPLAVSAVWSYFLVNVCNRATPFLHFLRHFMWIEIELKNEKVPIQKSFWLCSKDFSPVYCFISMKQIQFNGLHLGIEDLLSFSSIYLVLFYTLPYIPAYCLILFFRSRTLKIVNEQKHNFSGESRNLHKQVMMVRK